MQDLYSRASRLDSKKRQGFTIMELLIVVVVIAILAAITIVSYNGITANAEETTLKSDLKTAATRLNTDKVTGDGSFPGSKPGFMGDNLSYTGGGNIFCVSGSVNGKDFRIKETGTIEGGACSLPVATTMQTFSPGHCSALAIYAGSNPTAIQTLTDSRGGTTRTYEVAKLADGKCWMLTNLKLGSTSGAITLTPADSNVASNFTLPKITSNEDDTDLDTPYVYGPVPGDTGSGVTNYGYLYNWPAATAGETQASRPTGTAPYSVCPAGWRLPTGDTPGADFGQLDVAFGGIGLYAESGQANVTRWQPSGLFKTALTGHWMYGFNSQGIGGGFWSASADPYFPDYAFNVYFDWDYVSPSEAGSTRDYGVGVRCRLN